MAEKSAEWTALGVLGAAARDIWRRPLATLLLVGAVPSLWGALFSKWLWAHSAGSGWQDGPTPTQMAVGVSRQLVGSAWSSIFVGGQYLVALDIARGAVPRATRLFHGLKFALRIFLVTSAISLAFAPSAVLVAYHDALPSVGIPGAFLLLPIALVLVVRSVASVPLVVDRGDSVLGALRVSWNLTARNSWKITWLFLLFVPFVGALALAPRIPVLQEAIQCVFQAIGTITISHLYLQLTRNDRASPADSSVSDMHPGVAVENADLPVRGSGWAREVNGETE